MKAEVKTERTPLEDIVGWH